MPLSVGDKLGHYKIVAPLGAGGMGEVYKARDTQLEREVAIKVLPQALAQDPERLARFDREAKILAALNHPNIAMIHGLVESDGGRALVMELVPGDTLGARIKRGALPANEALEVARQIAEALEAAHEKGITHRDLKPGNIMITSTGLVKVLDFGLAAIAQPAAPFDPNTSPTLSMGMTQAGVIMGTAAYMSPEQAEGMPVDKRADIWSFGVVLWEMLTGKRLFEGQTVSRTLADVLRMEIDFSKLPADTPARLRGLLRRCLDREVRNRLRDIGEARVALDSAGEEPAELASVPAPSPLWLNARGWAITTGLATLALAALAAIHFFREIPPEPRVVRAAILPPSGTTFDFNSAQALPSISPDGRRIVFGAHIKDGKSPLWIRPINSLAAQPLAGTEGASFPFWSPDSRFIGFFADGKLKKIDTQGGPPVELADALSGRGGTWSPGGVIVFAPSGNGTPLLRISEAGGATSPATKLDQARDETVHKLPWFLPDGLHFLYEAQGGKPEAIRVASIASNDPSTTVIVEGTGSNAAYAEGRVLFLREQTLMAQPFDLKRLATDGEAVPLAEHVQTVLTSGKAGFFSVSANGLLLYQAGQAGGRDQLTWFDRMGNRLATLGEPSAISTIEFSPDRKRLGATVVDGSNIDVWTYDVARGTRGRFTFDAAEDRNSIWSPDGRTIIFDSRRKGHVDIYRRPSDASSAEELLYADDHDKFSTSWSPDGKFLLFTRGGTKTATDVWVLPLAPENASLKAEAAKPFAFVQTPFNDQNGKFSPNGHWVAYSSGESGRLEVYVARFPGPGGKQQISISGGDFPRWRSDGREVFYISLDLRLMAAEVTERGNTFQVGQVRPLFGPAQINRGYLYDVSADGQKFLLAVQPEQTTLEPLTLVENWSAGLTKSR